MKIKEIKAQEILDSRGTPTVSVEIELENGIKTSASVPSGASTGIHEARELRDGDIKRFAGKGVLKACRNIEEIIQPEIKKTDIENQAEIDGKMIELDGTKNKGQLGANAILAVSIAALRANAKNSGKELFETIGDTYGFHDFKLPRPMSVILEGGKHSDSNCEIQEYMIQIEEDDIEENLRKIELVYHSLESVLQDKGKNTNIGYEGAFGPDLVSNREGLDLVMQAIEKSGLKPESEVKIALDIASSEFYDRQSGNYLLKSENIALRPSQMVAYNEELARNYPIFSIEDGMYEDDWEGWQALSERLGNKTMLVGDDLFVTNTERIRNGIDRHAANAVLIKPNQIGTVTETIEAIKMARFAGWEPIVSHRSGETNDSFIADLAVAIGAKYIKAGAPARGERVAKYNRLLEIAGKQAISIEHEFRS